MIELAKDFKGKPINALTFGELLNSIGFVENEDGTFSIKNREFLDAYPVIMRDSVMEYGVFQGYVIENDKFIYDEKRYNGIGKVFNLFIAKPNGSDD